MWCEATTYDAVYRVALWYGVKWVGSREVKCAVMWCEATTYDAVYRVALWYGVKWIGSREVLDPLACMFFIAKIECLILYLDELLCKSNLCVAIESEWRPWCWAYPWGICSLFVKCTLCLTRCVSGIRTSIIRTISTELLTNFVAFWCKKYCSWKREVGGVRYASLS